MQLRERLQAAIEEHLAEQGGGFVTGFVCAVDMLDEEGDQCLLFTTPDGQRTALSMGLVEYSREWFLADARSQIATTFECDHDGEE